MDNSGWILVDDDLQKAVAEILCEGNGVTQSVEVQYIVPFPISTETGYYHIL